MGRRVRPWANVCRSGALYACPTFFALKQAKDIFSRHPSCAPTHKAILRPVFIAGCRVLNPPPLLKLVELASISVEAAAPSPDGVSVAVYLVQLRVYPHVEDIPYSL